MPKQVRLRRGTTLQHGSFTGADGEVTFDTQKKCLVLHDGATPGGRPLEGWVKLSPGGATITQEITGPVVLSGGDDEIAGLRVARKSLFQGPVSMSAGAEAMNVVVQQEMLPFTSTVALDFAGPGTRRLALSGPVAFTTLRVGCGHRLLVSIMADGITRPFTFPAGWRFVGGSAPASITAGKTGLLELWSFGTSDSEVVARWSVEP